MDTDLISFETLLATRDSAYWVMWGAIATGVAAFGSIMTLIVAGAALNTWKQQEKTKIRSELKRSLLALDYAVHMMPDSWNSLTAQRVNIAITQKAFHFDGDQDAIVAMIELKKCWHDALSAWVMCEGQLKQTNLTKLWNELSNIYLEFLEGETAKLKVLEKLAEMHSVKFIFD
ncbi:hypothetical protein KC915_22845 [Enterobacter hormaechei]|uniref:hypothetical protein n=1 Tax=Enterobacter TaxID=547 RepID=UPI000BDDC599|nr:MULTISPECIES: hypothetical protein [Enterobacter]PAC72056.1 hypothetical protein CGS27_02395 [Enterobacter cloacae]ELD3395081.1 hypothetical protein [Enterobacter hormaechei]ELD4125726.1 hypothetical protein [Enterobacter hormaechei]ELD7982262.1 hypothetical protein [Enterobacter hormaechei]EMB5587907.1 hypothetical protein [Enterobacter hormaechei]